MNRITGVLTKDNLDRTRPEDRRGKWLEVLAFVVKPDDYFWIVGDDVGTISGGAKNLRIIRLSEIEEVRYASVQRDDERVTT